MVITFVAGGLGNQMFQYAAGQALAIRLRTTHRVDRSYFKNNPNTRRSYELDRFNISAREVAPWEKWFITRLARPRGARLSAPLRKLGLMQGASVLHDPQQGFVRQIDALAGHVFLQGLWESERYFIAFSDVIRQEFSFRSAPDALNQATIGEIQSTESVALHVRRGDKATLTKPAHGVCGLDYYRTAIDLLSARVSKPHFFVFSDDPAWARENIKIKFPCTYLSHNAANQPTEDLRLMSHCQHFIIANSTFSWWGAWLGKNPAKCVIAPKNWFISPSISMQDRIPDRWIQV